MQISGPQQIILSTPLGWDKPYIIVLSQLWGLKTNKKVAVSYHEDILWTVTYLVKVLLMLLICLVTIRFSLGFLCTPCCIPSKTFFLYVSSWLAFFQGLPFPSSKFFAILFPSWKRKCESFMNLLFSTKACHTYRINENNRCNVAIVTACHAVITSVLFLYYLF